MSIKQIAKIRTSLPEVDRMVAHLADTLNPVLRGLTQPTAITAGKAHKNAAQAIPSATFTALDFQVADWDTDAAFKLGAACRWTCPSAKGGYYHVSAACSLQIGATAVNNLLITIIVNGAEVAGRGSRGPISANQVGDALASTDLKLNPGDYVQAQLYQDSGGTLNTEGLAQSCHFSIHRIAGS